MKNKMSEEANSRIQEKPEPILLGDFLVSHLLKPKQKFNIEEGRIAEVASGLPENIRGLVNGWIFIYLAWLYKAYACKKFGMEFTNTLLLEVHDKLQESPDDEVRDLWPTLEYWFANLDTMTCHFKKSACEFEVPFEVYVALCFMLFDADSPYYMNLSAETNMAEFDLGFILGSAARKAKQTIQAAIDKGGTTDNNNDSQ